MFSRDRRERIALCRSGLHLPPPKKSCLDSMRNALARTVAQIRTGHWRSAVYLNRTKMADDKCWFCQSPARMTRSHVLLHCPNAKLRAARTEAWEGKNPGGVRVLLANPRWERRLVKFLELSGVGRVMADGTDEEGAYAARMDEWVAWETIGGTAPRARVNSPVFRPEGRRLCCCCCCCCCEVLPCFDFHFSFPTLSCKGGSYPETCAQRTAEGGGFFCWSRPSEGRLLAFSFCLS
jgi:hypothetical protein